MLSPLRHHRMRTNVLVVVIFILGAYLMIFESANNSSEASLRDRPIDVAAIEREINRAKRVEIVTYKPESAEEEEEKEVRSHGKKSPHKGRLEDDSMEETLKLHRTWAWADRAIDRHQLFPDTPDVDEVLKALQHARIVHADTLDIGDYESGTSEKWVVTLEGGQKAMMKISWSKEDRGKMKKDALCNFGFEMVDAEIAAFHLHRILGFRNTPYVTGRQVNLRTEILPVASPSVSKQITVKSGNETCVTGKCFFCEKPLTICPPGGVVESSITYWVPRHLKLYTYPPGYMPWSTPRMDEWQLSGFNNHTYCSKVRTMHPYDLDWYYDDLMDFAVLDTIMYHYDSKHYVVYDRSDAHGLTVRIDHGRTFCAYDRDDYHVFLAPLFQCCRLRWATWENLKAYRGRLLTRRLKEELSKDPLAPILSNKWFPVLERRLEHILDTVEKCAKANDGHHNILVG